MLFKLLTASVGVEVGETRGYFGQWHDCRGVGAVLMEGTLEVAVASDVLVAAMLEAEAALGFLIQ